MPRPLIRRPPHPLAPAQRVLALAGLVLALALAALWAMGALAGLEQAVAATQKAVQDRLAGAVRALRGGEPGAMAGLLAVCFGYGLAHAAGPGHDKALIGGYGVARRVSFARLSMVALAASLAQAAVAVLLVLGLVAALGWTRAEVLGLADSALPLLSHALVAALGGWLVWRGLRGLRRQAAGAAPHPAAAAPQVQGHHDHGHNPGPEQTARHAQTHAHTHADCGCGHSHGPDLAELARAAGWRDTALLVAGVAMRPCSGALFLLILGWQLGLTGAAVAGTFAMGLGTAAVTITAAGLAVWAREGTLAGLSGAGRITRALPVLELLAGGAILAAALSLMFGAAG